MEFHLVEIQVLFRLCVDVSQGTNFEMGTGHMNPPISLEHVRFLLWSKTLVFAILMPEVIVSSIQV